MRTVLDASALLALLGAEQGADRVAAAIADGAVVSAVNLSEVVAKLSDWQMPADEVRDAVEGLGLEIVPFDEELAFRAGLLRRATRASGLSLGDRACLALGAREGGPVLTTDRAWQGVAGTIALEWIR